MSSDETPNVPQPQNTRDAVREKAQQVKAQQSRARWARRTTIAILAVLAIAAIVFAIVSTVSSSVSKPKLTPTGMKDGGVTVSAEAMAGAAGATPTASPTPTDGADKPSEEATEDAAEGVPVDIHIYVDYLSPGAGEFEEANAAQLAGWIKEEAVTVTYHPVALLTASSSGTKYSLRAASAAACVASGSPESFYAYNHELLTDQPEIDTAGHTDAELAALAEKAGVKNAAKVAACIENKDYVAWAREATTQALEGPLPGSKDLKLSGAPMVLVGGNEYVGALDDPAEFSQFVLTVASDAYYSTPSPTPTATDAPAQ